MKKRDFYHTVGFGALNVDRLGKVDEVLVDGETVVSQEKRGAGGSAANTISALAELGWRTAHIGVVGNDQEGQLLFSDFENRGVDISLIAKKNGSSGVILGLTDNCGNRALYIFPGVNSELSNLDILRPNKLSTQFLHLSSFVNQKELGYQQLYCQIKFVSQIAPEIKVSIVPGMIYARLGITRLEPLFTNCHYIFLTREELKILFDKAELEEAERLLSPKTEAVIITAGTEGVYWITREKKGHIPAFEVELVDSTGAGDILVAGFLHGQLLGLDARSSVIAGNLLASYYVQQLGAREGCPSNQEFDQRLERIIYESE